MGGSIILFFGEGAKVLVLIYQKTIWAPRPHWLLVGHSTKMDQKCKYFDQNEKISFGTKILILGGSKIFGTLILGNLLDTCFVLKILTGEAPMDC